MDPSIVLFLVLAAALLVVLIASPSARAVFVDALLHPTSSSRIERSEGRIRVVRGDDAQV